MKNIIKIICDPKSLTFSIPSFTEKVCQPRFRLYLMCWLIWLCLSLPSCYLFSLCLICSFFLFFYLLLNWVSLFLFISLASLLAITLCCVSLVVALGFIVYTFNLSQSATSYSKRTYHRTLPFLLLPSLSHIALIRVL